MVNVVGAVQGGILNRGTKMESDKPLQDWIASSGWKPTSVKDAKHGEFLSIGPDHQSAAKDIKAGSNVAGNFEGFVKELAKAGGKPQVAGIWLEESNKIAEVGKLMNQVDNQKLLGLALSTTSGVSLRYCIQHEISPAAKYWTYFADNLNIESHSKTVAVVVGSSSPVLSVCRVIAPLIAQRANVVLVLDGGQLALPCLILADILKKAGLNCTVFLAGSDRLKELVTLAEVEWIVCGSLSQALSLRNAACNLRLELDGKRAIVAMETSDCDAAVDAALCALKTRGKDSPGTYLIVQDSLLEDVTWRVKDRMKSAQVGAVLDAVVDFAEGQNFQAPKQLMDYFQGTRLDVAQVGNARVVFNAQPSLPITQWERLGQTLLVLSYRTVPELVTLLGNLPGLNELSLWVDHQAAAWQVINQVQVARVWINGFAQYEPGFDQLTLIQRTQTGLKTLKADGSTNTALFAVLDGLRASQRNWATQPADHKRVLLGKLLKQLMSLGSLKSQQGELLEILRVVQGVRETVADGAGKTSVSFDLTSPLGVVAVVDGSNGDAKDVIKLLRLVALAVLRGNAVLLSSNGPAALDIAKTAKDAGLPVVSSPLGEDNSRALVKHRGVNLVVLFGPSVALPIIEDAPYSGGVWQVGAEQDTDEGIVRYVTRRKRVWMAVGDGLAS